MTWEADAGVAQRETGLGNIATPCLEKSQDWRSMVLATWEAKDGLSQQDPVLRKKNKNCIEKSHGKELFPEIVIQGNFEER